MSSGSRLTNSPGFFSAADWVVKRLGEWGISAHQEKWGPFGRGWTYTRFSAHMIEPQSTPLIGAPLAYTPGTNGPVSGDAMIVAINNEGGLRQVQGHAEGEDGAARPGARAANEPAAAGAAAIRRGPCDDRAGARRRPGRWPRTASARCRRHRRRTAGRAGWRGWRTAVPARAEQVPRGRGRRGRGSCRRRTQRGRHRLRARRRHARPEGSRFHRRWSR